MKHASMVIAALFCAAAWGGAGGLTSARPEDENTLQEPLRISPREEPLAGLAGSFSRVFPAYSVTLLRLNLK